LILNFGSIPGVHVWQIGNEGGFLEAPVNLTTGHCNQSLLAPAERTDLIVDFTDVPPGKYILENAGPDEPFAGGVPGDDFKRADSTTTGQILQFRVVPAPAPDPSTPPEFLQLPPIRSLPSPTLTRRLALLEQMSGSFKDSPSVTLLGTITGDPNGAAGAWTKLLWMDGITENPSVGATETWEIYNATADAHPIHIHETAFEVIDRQKISVDEKSQKVSVLAASDPTPREPWETGFKDTVVAYPGQVTRVRAQFNTPGQFVWHCHILEHEDNEMMRPYRVGPQQPHQPRQTLPVIGQQRNRRILQ
jgi:FtsP/CotA-like multicopper oxidase with cupredoxin domain